MRSPDALSNRQKDILDYIEDFVQDHGYPPAIRQIQEKLDISSTSVVAYNLKALESKGMIKREGKVSRGITMSDATPMNNGSRRRGALVPLLGVITAGSPLPGPEEIAADSAETIEVPAELAPPEKLKDVYALRVRGQSMIDALIDDGDIVLIRYQETAENGQMVVALIDGNYATVKKFYREPDFIRLEPANPQFKPIFIKTPERIQIQGVVRGLIRSYNNSSRAV